MINEDLEYIKLKHKEDYIRYKQRDCVISIFSWLFDLGFEKTKSSETTELFIEGKSGINIFIDFVYVYDEICMYIYYKKTYERKYTMKEYNILDINQTKANKNKNKLINKIKLDITQDIKTKNSELYSLIRKEKIKKVLNK